MCGEAFTRKTFLSEDFFSWLDLVVDMLRKSLDIGAIKNASGWATTPSFYQG